MQPGAYGAPPPKQKSPTWIIVLIVLLGGGVVGLGVLASLAIYGVRRYIASAKTAEAKNTIGAISRGAMASYEREGLDPSAPHKVCGSAVTVPAVTPSGKKYQPATGTGADFETGDSENGWRCLKFAMTQPIYYQYSYHAGSGYIAPPSQSPGPDGFEAAARGDLDGDGDLSLFALTGRTSSGTIKVSTTIYVENEFE